MNVNFAVCCMVVRDMGLPLLLGALGGCWEAPLDFDPDSDTAAFVTVEPMEGPGWNGIYLVEAEYDVGEDSWTRIRRIDAYGRVAATEEHRSSVTAYMNEGSLSVQSCVEWVVASTKWGEREAGYEIALTIEGRVSLAPSEGEPMWSVEFPEYRVVGGPSICRWDDESGDGQADLLVGLGDPSAPKRTTENSAVVLDACSGTQLRRLEIQVPGGLTGIALRIDDANQNGFSEFIARSGWDSTGVSCIDGSVGKELWSIEGFSSWSSIGESVAQLGDLDGDGVADLAFGEFSYVVEDLAFGEFSYVAADEPDRVLIVSAKTGTILTKWLPPENFDGGSYGWRVLSECSDVESALLIAADWGGFELVRFNNTGAAPTQRQWFSTEEAHLGVSRIEGSEEFMFVVVGEQALHLVARDGSVTTRIMTE